MVDTNPGDAERLRQYWEHGAGAAKIRWGTHGDAERCHLELSKYMTSSQAWGYCNLMHKRMTGMYTGDKKNK